MIQWIRDVARSAVGKERWPYGWKPWNDTEADDQVHEVL